MERTFPENEWTRRRPEEVGFSSGRLAAVEAWLLRIAEGEPFRLVIARHGTMVAEWGQGIDVEEALGQASASKSYFSCMLGIAVAEGKIPGPDARVFDYYPEVKDPTPERRGLVQSKPSLTSQSQEAFASSGSVIRVTTPWCERSSTSLCRTALNRPVGKGPCAALNKPG